MFALLMAAALLGGQDWPPALPSEWVVAGSGDRGILFLQRHRTNPTMFWTRFEYRPGDAEGFGSGRSLGEFNCETWQLRTLTSETWTGPDMTGEKIEDRSDPGPWTYQPPGSFGERQLEILCGT